MAMPVKRAVDSDSLDNRIAIASPVYATLHNYSSASHPHTNYIAVVGFASNAMTETFMKFLIEKRGFTQGSMVDCC